MAYPGKTRVKASLILLTYNQEEYVADAISSAFSQTYPSLQIIISDDASTDRTFQIIQEEVVKYTGHHQVLVRQNDSNLGINEHINEVMKEVDGHFVIISGGDDVSLPYRTERLLNKFVSGVCGIFSNAELIDRKGNPKGLLVRDGYKAMKTWQEMVLAGTHGTWGCTLSWEKRVSDVFGPLPTNILGEDAVIPFRSSLLGGIDYIDEALVRYRDHGKNVSFWVREKRLTDRQLIRLGIEIMNFKVRMCDNWKDDLEIAHLKGVVSNEELQWGQFVLDENIAFFNGTKALLLMPLWKLLIILPIFFFVSSIRMSKKVFIINAMKQTGWKLLNSVLHYRFPVLHKKIRSIFGRNT